jgi:hypothetical protein
MAGGSIPLARAGRPIGVVQWEGSVASGTWRFVPRGTPEEAARDRRALRQVVEHRGDLARRWFAGRGDRAYRGWQGFPGLLGALEAALPAVGIAVLRSAVVWPGPHRSPAPRGALLGEEGR